MLCSWRVVEWHSRAELEADTVSPSGKRVGTTVVTMQRPPTP